MDIDPVELTRKLVQINSENYTSDEQQIGTFCSSILQGLDFQIFEEAMNDRNINIIAVKLFDGNKISDHNIEDYRFIMFSGHMDTVPGYHLAHSEKAEIREGKIYGRGACDMKSGIACFLSAIHSFFTAPASEPATAPTAEPATTPTAEPATTPTAKPATAPTAASTAATVQSLNPTHEYTQDKARGIIIVLSVREEIGCEGIRYIRSPFVSKLLKRAELCILAEPSDNELIVAHNGYSSYSIRFHGKSAHSGTAFAGDNAIYKAANFLVELEKYYRELQERPVVVPELGKPQINPGIIKGGTQINIVPNFCDLEVDRRIMFGETSKDAAEELLNIAKKYDPTLEFKVFDKGNPYLYPSSLILGNDINKWFPQLSNKQIEKNDRILCSLIRLTGKKIRYLPAYTEADHYYSAFGIPTIILGPGSIKAAHIDEEYVGIQQIVECTVFFKRIIDAYVEDSL
jgi:acetylornithine deacetylase/succinyl-diaminopimelate desuccinylase-like protein